MSSSEQQNCKLTDSMETREGESKEGTEKSSCGCQGTGNRSQEREEGLGKSTKAAILN